MSTRPQGHQMTMIGLGAGLLLTRIAPGRPSFQKQALNGMFRDWWHRQTSQSWAAGSGVVTQVCRIVGWIRLHHMLHGRCCSNHVSGNHTTLHCNLLPWLQIFLCGCIDALPSALHQLLPRTLVLALFPSLKWISPCTSALSAENL